MQNRFGLLVTGVMPIYMIMPRYSHNYALFYQLLDNNLFTHRNTYAVLREATSETYGPRSIFHHINRPTLSYFYCRLFCNLYFPIYIIKIPKIFILLSLSDLTFASVREGIDNPFITLVASFLFVYVGTRELRVASYWIDTLVLKTEGNTYATVLHHPFLFKLKSTQAQEVARRISGAVPGEIYAKSSQVKTYQVPITTLIPRITLFAICLSFSSPPLHPCRFIRPLFRLPSFRLLLVCLCVGLTVCHDGSR